MELHKHLCLGHEEKDRAGMTGTWMSRAIKSGIGIPNAAFESLWGYLRSISTFEFIRDRLCDFVFDFVLIFKFFF